MSTAEAEIPEAPPIPVDEEEPWIKKLLKDWGLLYLAHDAFVLDKIQKQSVEALNLARATRTGTLGKPDATPPAAGDDMGFSLGNEHKEYHYHYQTEQAANTTSTAKKGLGMLGTAAVIGATLLGGGGLGAVAMHYLNKPTTTIINPVDPSIYGFDGESVPTP